MLKLADSDRSFVRHLIREMRSAIRANPEAPTVTTGPADPDVLERVLLIAMQNSAAPAEESAVYLDSAGLRGVIAERRRQVEVEGWTPEHDDEYRAGELLTAAVCYAQRRMDEERFGSFSPNAPAAWPWDLRWWKPKHRRRDLERAATLLIAEIDRMDRAAQRRGDAAYFGLDEVSPAAPTEGPAVLDQKLWEVEVRISGERILTIGHSHVSGVSEPELERYADVVRNCAEHLKSFIGTGEPTPCFACGDSRQERWMGANGEEIGPCSVCQPQTFICPSCGGNDDDRQLMCEACGGVGLLGDPAPAEARGDQPPGMRSREWRTLWDAPEDGAPVWTFGTLHADGIGERAGVFRGWFDAETKSWVCKELGSYAPAFWAPDPTPPKAEADHG